MTDCENGHNDDENPLQGTAFEKVWAKGMKIAARGDVRVVNAGDGTGGRYVCAVKSQTDAGTTYTVKNSPQKGWTCSCDMRTEGRKLCMHIVAAFVHLATAKSNDSGRKRKGTRVLDVPPPRWCSHCGGTDCKEKEQRPLKRMEGSRCDEKYSVICRCTTCGRTFADRPSFAGCHYAECVVLKVLILVARKMTPKDAAETVNEEFDTNVSERTACRWVDKYSTMISAYAKGLEIRGGEAIAVDEKFYKSKGEERYVYTAVCLKSRFTIAVHHDSNKLGYDATDFFKTIEEMIGMVPLLLISDGLNGYKTGYKNAFKAHPPTTLYLPDASVNGVHVNNSIVERSNGHLASCIGRARGFNSDEPGLITLDIIYRNFIRKHMGLDGSTPAEKEGIHIPGANKMRTLIRCAAAAAFNFA